MLQVLHRVLGALEARELGARGAVQLPHRLASRVCGALQRRRMRMLHKRLQIHPVEPATLAPPIIECTYNPARGDAGGVRGVLEARMPRDLLAVFTDLDHRPLSLD